MEISKHTPAQDAIALVQLVMGAAAVIACPALYPCTIYNLRTSVYPNLNAYRANSQMIHLQLVLAATLHVNPAQDHFRQNVQPVETTYN